MRTEYIVGWRNENGCHEEEYVTLAEACQHARNVVSCSNVTESWVLAPSGNLHRFTGDPGDGEALGDEEA